MVSRFSNCKAGRRVLAAALLAILGAEIVAARCAAAADAAIDDILSTKAQLESQRPESTYPALAKPRELPDATLQASPLTSTVTGAVAPRDAAAASVDSISRTSAVADQPPSVDQQIQQLGQGVEELKNGEQQLAVGEQQLKSGLQQLAAGLRVSTLDPNIKIGIFGALRGEMLLSDARPLESSAPFFLSPNTGLNQDTADVHGKSTALGMGVEGPEICGYKSGGLVLIYFFGQQVFANTTGVFFAQGYGELKSDEDRLAFGVQADVFNPVNPTVLNWGLYLAAGNTGYLRGQLRYERYFYCDPDTQWTLTTALSNPVPTELFTFENPALLENNGWPDCEARLAVGFGQLYQDGAVKCRPIELGVSGVVGEVRTTKMVGLAFDRIVDRVWGAGFDAQVDITNGFGFRGELYTGQGLATYGGAILQMLNLTTFNTIRSSGGWIEVFDYLTPCLHTHWGFAVDDPVNDDISLSQRTYNQAVFGNLMWDVTKNFQVGFEVSHWETDYKALPAADILGDNAGMIYHLRLQYAF